MLKTKKIEYKDGDTILEGYYAYHDGHGGKKPTVLVTHDWSGRNDFACQKAEQIADLGYNAFAIDMYGKGKLGQTTEEKSALMQPFVQDRKLLLRRINAALETVQGFADVNTAKMAAIGFCFGGLCVLDLARGGAEIRGVVSFHGLLNPPGLPSQDKIHAKILVLHGFEDPMANSTQQVAFEKEMTDAGADWQIHIYGNTKHAFTNPQANDTALGLIYNNVAAKRSWESMKVFFNEIFS